MKEKERYVIQEDDLEIEPDAIIDTKTDIMYECSSIDMDSLCKILNQQDQRIKELKEENKQLKQSQKQLAISKLEKLKNYFDDSNDDKYNESEGWVITNRNVVDYVNKQIEELMKYREMKNE